MAKSPRDTQQEPPARRGRISAIGLDAPAVGAGAFSRAGFPDAGLVLNWAAIAGPDVARLAQPLKFHEGPSGGTLTLRAAPGAALFLAHDKRGLAERINAYLGRPAVAQIKFVQVARPLAVPPKPPRQKPAGPLPSADPSRRYLGPEDLARALQALARRRAPL